MRTLLVALELARIIAGEAGHCPVEAKVAVAQVVANRVSTGLVTELRQGWFGDADPEHEDWAVALTWQTWPDLVNGAVYMIGPGDRAKMPFLDHPERRWQCSSGWVEAWH